MPETNCLGPAEWSKVRSGNKRVIAKEAFANNMPMKSCSSTTFTEGFFFFHGSSPIVGRMQGGYRLCTYDHRAERITSCS